VFEIENRRRFPDILDQGLSEHRLADLSRAENHDDGVSGQELLQAFLLPAGVGSCPVEENWIVELQISRFWSDKYVARG
jgi:hypothetical protein